VAVGGRIYTAVNGAKMEGNPSEMARAPTGQVFASRALAAAPREPGSGEKVDLGVPGEPGRGGGFAREGPGSQAGAGHQTTRVACGGAWLVWCGTPNRPKESGKADLREAL
jgi:hypothetical protein